MKAQGFVTIALWLTIANVVGKLLGFGKDILISYYYGTSTQTDAIFLALSIPTILLGVFTSATDSAIIPQYNRLLYNDGRIRADRHFSGITNFIIVLGLLVSFLILFFPDILVSIFAPGFNNAQRIYSVRFLRLFSFVGFLHILYCFFCTYTIRYKHVTTRSVLAFSSNLLIVLVLLIYPDPQMLYLSIAFLGGSIIQAIFPIISSRHLGYKHLWIIDIQDVEFKRFWLIFTPIMLSALLLDLNMFVDRFLASSFADGSISSLNYASRITSMFDSMIVIGIGVVILPLLSQQNIEGNKDKFISTATVIFKGLFICLLPLVVICMILSQEIIQIVYQRGRFDTNSVNIVSELFFCYSPLILLISLQSVISRFFHSLENTKLPLYVTAMSVVVNIVLSIFLSRIFGLKGLAIATTFAVFLNVLFLFLCMYHKIGWDKTVMGVTDFFKIVLAIFVLIIVVLLTGVLFLHPFLYVLLAVVMGGAFYLLAIFVLMKKDIIMLWRLIKR